MGYSRGRGCRSGLVATAAAAAVVVVAAEARYERLECAVLAHAVYERSEERPTASSESARGKCVSARSENEQDNENPE